MKELCNKFEIEPQIITFFTLFIAGKGGQPQDRNAGQYGYVSPYPPYPNGSSPLVSVTQVKGNNSNYSYTFRTSVFKER